MNHSEMSNLRVSANKCNYKAFNNSKSLPVKLRNRKQFSNLKQQFNFLQVQILLMGTKA